MRHSSVLPLLVLAAIASAVCLLPTDWSGSAGRATAQDPYQNQPGTGSGNDRPDGPDAPPLGEPDSALARMDREVAALAERARRSVVKINALTKLPLPHPDVVEEGQPTEFEIPVTYSGLVVRSDGFIVTVADAVERAAEFKVLLPDGRERAATLWASDSRSNLAVLHIDGLKPGELTPAKLDGPAELRPGQFLLSCGNPFGLTRSVATGIVTGIDRTIVIEGQPFFGVIQTNATINTGDPGGAVLASDGSFVGMIWSTYGRSSFGQAETRPEMGGNRKDADMLRDAIRRLMGLANDPEADPFTSDDLQRYWKQRMNDYYRELAKQQEQQVFLSAQGINFVLPAALVRHVSNELIERKRVARGTLGIRLQQRISADGQPVLLCIEVGGPSRDAGVNVGDILFQVDEQTVSTMADVFRIMQTARAGQNLHIRLIRGAKQVDLQVELAERKD